MQLLRREFGIAEPVKRGMEAGIVAAGEWRPLVLGNGGSAGVHADVLAGRDTEVSWEDVYTGTCDAVSLVLFGGSLQLSRIG